MATAQNKKAVQKAASGKKKKVKVATRRNRKNRRGSAGWLFFPILILIVAIFYPEASVVLVIGFLPTFCAMAVAQGPDRAPRILTICLFNLSGIIPIIMELGSGRYAGMGVVGPLVDVYAWFIMYGSAAVGIVVNWIVPFAVAAILTYLDRIDVHKLQIARRKIIDEWGEAVTENDS